jgi:two-component system, probable response regulator PhcQ
VAAAVKGPHTILVVDDEPRVLDALRRTLRDPAYRVLTASDGREALSLLAAEQVDVLLSDIDMPGMNGIELVKEVRRRFPEVIRLLLTGDASLDSALDAINDGEVYRYLVKPWKGAELRQTVADACARLGELRAAAQASQRITARDRMLAELEREHPGIREVRLEAGVYWLDAGRIDAAAGRVAAQSVAAFAAPPEQGTLDDQREGSDSSWT